MRKLESKIVAYYGTWAPTVQNFFVKGIEAQCIQELETARRYTAEGSKRKDVALRKRKIAAERRLEIFKARKKQREAEYPPPSRRVPPVWKFFIFLLQKESRRQDWLGLPLAERDRIQKIDWHRRRRAQRRPEDLIEKAFRGRLNQCVKNKGVSKVDRTGNLVGCTLRYLKNHLEKNFRDGMSWENYGPHWHIDHIKPCAKFDLSAEEEQRACFHWSNLQPLLAVENMLKGARYGN